MKIEALFLAISPFEYAAAHFELPHATSPVEANANSIFNAIHSSLRQWGSSLRHNGMSFFMATVPAGTRFYHGCQFPERIVGREWFAFEHEHAAMFSRWDFSHSNQTLFATDNQRNEQKLLKLPNAGDMLPPGFLHSYVSKKNLRMLYIDGMAAAKTDMGPLDSQDYILLNKNFSDSYILYDFIRGRELCDLAATQWRGRIDGFVRMEAGSEALICSAEERFNMVRAIRARARNATAWIGVPVVGWDAGDVFAYFRAVTSRYNGVGGGRVVLDYETFVTAYAYPVKISGSKRKPRLKRGAQEGLSDVRRAVYNMVLSDERSSPKFNWQNVADMIVAKYATELKYLVSSRFPTPQLLSAQIERAMTPFIDHDNRNATLEVDQCTKHYLPPSYTECTASRAIHHVSQVICSTLNSAAGMEDHGAAMEAIYGLIDYLDWTTWKDCGHCGSDEVCFVAMWPAGKPEDHDKPLCLDQYELLNRTGYWHLNLPSIP